MATTLKLTSSESVTLVESRPELLEVEGSYDPSVHPPPPHLHPTQDERFEVLEGSLRTRVGGVERDLGVGDQLDIRRRTPHQIWNPNPEPARVTWQTRPGGRTEEWFRALDRLQNQGKVDRDGMPRRLSMLPLLLRYRDVFRLAIRG